MHLFEIIVGERSLLDHLGSLLPNRIPVYSFIFTFRFQFDFLGGCTTVVAALLAWLGGLEENGGRVCFPWLQQVDCEGRLFDLLLV